MKKVTMPDPVAKVTHRSVWGDAPVFIGNGKPHPPTGALLITTDQAEAYADARVRGALEEAANVCDSSAAKHASILMKYETSSLESIHFQAVLEEAEEIADDIRALIKYIA